jgi:hypothetical protein
VFGRRRWRMPWSSETSGEPWAADTPTVKVIPPGAKASAGTGTAPGGAGGSGGAGGPDGAGAPGATSSRLAGGPAGEAGSPGSGDPPSTRVIRIPASVGIGHAGDSAPGSAGAEATGQRSPFALSTREGQSADAPPWEQAESDQWGRTASAVIAVVIVCALLGGLAAVAATLSGRPSSRPDPAASIPPTGIPAPAGRAGTGVSGAGARHSSRRPGAPPKTAAPLPAPTRGTAGKPAAKQASAGRTARRAAGRTRQQKPQPKPKQKPQPKPKQKPQPKPKKHQRKPRRAVPPRHKRQPARNAPGDDLAAR